MEAAVVQSRDRFAGLSAELPPDLRQAVALSRPHDGATFEEMERLYAYKTTSDRRKVFTWMVLDEARRVRAERGTVRVLDVGCGRGIGRELRYTRVIASQVDELWGVEPDRDVEIEERLFRAVSRTSMEDAEVPAGAFDLVYCFMVMEHVTDPAGFMAKVAHVLRPGGVFLFATPNGRHYFTRIASLARQLRLDELILRLVIGKQTEEYHYPVVYRFNTRRQIEAVTRTCGMGGLRLAFTEEAGPAGYLPGPLRPLLWTMDAKRRLIRDSSSLLNLYGRMERADQSRAVGQA